MKYVVVLGDGMADRPLDELGGMTPLEYARTPNMDRLARVSVLGRAKTIPKGMKPGSDTANLAVLGYDPKRYYTGRSPLEALSIGVPLAEEDVALRCNLVTLSEEETNYGEKKILDHSSGEISTRDAAVLLEAVRAELADERHRFYVGTSYRHLTVLKGGRVMELTPPHDILGRKISEYLPEEEELRRMMEQSFDLLNHHPLNEKRAEAGLPKANSIWFWGAGTRPALKSFYEKTGKRGAMISAVDLLKGIAAGAGMRVIEVEGADGTLHTNYEGKAAAAVRTLLENGDDFVYLHVEAPDEMGHQGSVGKKVRAIEYLDTRVLGPLTETLDKSGTDYRLLLLPDHPTPVSIRTHTSDPIPFLLFDSTQRRKEADTAWTGGKPHKYNEREAEESGLFLEHGHLLLNLLLERGSER